MSDAKQDMSGGWHPVTPGPRGWPPPALTGEPFDEAVRRCRARMPVTLKLGEMAGRLENVDSGKMILEHETKTVRPGEPVGPAKKDDPLFKRRGLPLLITHADAPADEGAPYRLLHVAAEAVGGLLERSNLGVWQGEVDPVVGGPVARKVATPYGLGSFPERTTVTWHRDGSVKGLVRDYLWDKGFFGPYLVVHNQGAKFQGHRVRIKDGGREYDVDDVRTEHLKPERMLVVCATPDVVKLVVGLEPMVTRLRAVRRPDKFKVMAILPLLLRTGLGGECGIVDYNPED